MVQLPHSFSPGLNTVAVFTEVSSEVSRIVDIMCKRGMCCKPLCGLFVLQNPEQARVAREQGAQFVGGPELVEKVCVCVV